MKQVREDQLISEAYQTMSEKTEFKPSNIVPDANTLTAFTSMLEKEGFPKPHESPEVFNLLQNFLKTIPKDNQTTEVKKALQVALQNVHVDSGLVTDYFDYEAGFDLTPPEEPEEPEGPEEEENESDYWTTATHQWRGIDFNDHSQPIGYKYLGLANFGQEIPESDDWVMFASTSNKEHYLSPKLKMWYSTDSSG